MWAQKWSKMFFFQICSKTNWGCSYKWLASAGSKISLETHNVGTKNVAQVGPRGMRDTKWSRHIFGKKF